MMVAATSTPASDASQTLRELVGQIIKTAEQPLTVADLKNALKARNVPVGGRQGYREADIEADVQAEVVAGAAHVHPAAKASGKPKFWHTPPKTAAEQVAETVRARATKLQDDELVTESQLGKLGGAKATPETTQAFTNTLNELLQQGELFRRGTKFGKVPPLPEPTQAEKVAKAVREKVKNLSDDELVTEAKLGKPKANQATPETTKAFADMLNELLTQKALFRHGPTKYSKTPPPPEPTPVEKVARAVREKAATLKDDKFVTESRLGKPKAGQATPETLQAFTDTLNELLQQGKLFRHGTKFGKTPPKWFEADPAKKSFDSLVKAAKQLLDMQAASADEVFARLRQKLGLTATPAPLPETLPTSDFTAAFDAAFERLDHVHGSNNFVSLVDLRAAFPHVTREAFDAALNDLRRSRRYTLKSAERVHGFTPEQQAAAIKEEGEYLLYVSRVRS